MMGAKPFYPGNTITRSSADSKGLPSIYALRPRRSERWKRISNTLPLLSLVSLFMVFVTYCSMGIHDLMTVYRQAISQSLEIKSISVAEFQEGLLKCSQIHSRKHSESLANPWKPREMNPGFKLGNKTVYPLLLEHVNLLDGDGSIYRNASILFENGIVKDLWIQGKSPAGFTTSGKITKVDGKLKWVTPGLVDMHSHVGTDPWPELDMTSDTNELSDSPLTPFVRSLDGIHPEDKAIRIINSGGVTTSLVLPGSGNLIGGEAFVIKHRSAQTVSELLYDFEQRGNSSKQWRYIKMACGENPIGVYGRRKGIMPNSRLGEGWLFRKMFYRAQQLKKEQDEWCQKAQMLAEREIFPKALMANKFPEDLEIELIVALLRGDVKLNNHCYTAMIRHSHEFDFKIATFHHAAEAWKIAPILAKENISVAIFSDLWGYKKEAYDVSVRASQILADAGVDVAFKSDHPVTSSQHLIFEAAKAHSYGLNQGLAIQAVTSKPAKALGLDHIGFLKRGYDADAVLWNRYPLDAGAHPLKVWIEGHETFTHPRAEEALAKEYPAGPIPNDSNTPYSEPCVKRLDTYLLYNISVIYAAPGNTLFNTDNGLSLIVEKGTIRCFGVQDVCNFNELERFNDSILAINAAGGVVTPGFVAAYSRLGLEEIEAEKLTKDGKAKGFEYRSGGTSAADGLRVGMASSKQLSAAYHSGVLFAIAVPRASGLVQGKPCVFRTGADKYDEAIVGKGIGVAVTIGEGAKDGVSVSNSLAGQISLLRQLLISSDDASEDFFSSIKNGDNVLYIEAHEANDIARCLEVLREGRKSFPLLGKTTTIVGGAEAWLLADELAAANVSVILRPSRCTPGTWATRRCRLPSSFPSAIDTLRRAGVKVILASDEDNQTRNLRFEAAWAYSESNNPAFVAESKPLAKEEAIGLISWNAADAAGIKDDRYAVGRIKVGHTASFLLHQGDPLSLQTLIHLIADGAFVTFYPEQL